MAKQTESPVTFNAGEALARYTRVKLGTTGRDVVYADQADSGAYIGSTIFDVALGDNVAIVLKTSAKTFKGTANGAISDKAAVYAGNDGKISASVSGNQIGIAVQAAGADGDIIEYLGTGF